MRACPRQPPTPASPAPRPGPGRSGCGATCAEGRRRRWGPGSTPAWRRTAPGGGRDGPRGRAGRSDGREGAETPLGLGWGWRRTGGGVGERLRRGSCGAAAWERPDSVLLMAAGCPGSDSWAPLEAATASLGRRGRVPGQRGRETRVSRWRGESGVHGWCVNGRASGIGAARAGASVPGECSLACWPVLRMDRLRLRAWSLGRPPEPPEDAGDVSAVGPAREASRRACEGEQSGMHPGCPWEARGPARRVHARTAARGTNDDPVSENSVLACIDRATPGRDLGACNDSALRWWPCSVSVLRKWLPWLPAAR